MKKLLLCIALFSFSTLFAQDWAPFKITDTLRHYLSYYYLATENQIQTVVQDSSYQDSTITIKIFKRGFSNSSFGYNPNYFTQIIKGQVLGDTARIYADSSVFTSIDQFGYRIYFPHRYSLNMNFTLATSAASTLKATVDSLFTDSINGNIDSLVCFTIAAYDSLNTSTPTHDFNGAKLIVSKNNGLINTVDFTNLIVKVNTEQYFMAKTQFTERDKFELTTGDEYHYTNDSVYHFNYTNHVLRVISDTLIGSQRTVKLQHKTKRKIDTITKSFVDSLILFNDYSLIIEEDLSPWQGKRIKIPEFSVCEYCSTDRFNHLLYRESFYDIYNSANGQDSILNSSGLSDDITKLLIGVDYEFRRWGSGGGNNPYLNIKRIVYIKKGSQTWGTPLSRPVGVVEAINKPESFNFYPNPTTGGITIFATKELKAIQLYNIHGLQVKELRPNKQELIQLEIDGSPGLYFLRLQMQDGSVKTSKVLKN